MIEDMLSESSEKKMVFVVAAFEANPPPNSEFLDTSYLPQTKEEVIKQINQGTMLPVRILFKVISVLASC